MDFETIRYEVADRVLTITLNRPDRLNAWTPTMQRELIAALDAADADDDVRAIVFTGEGRGYCAGADLQGGGSTFDWREREREGDTHAGTGVPRDGGGTFTLRLFDCTKPTIAAINGPAVGVGITMTLAMDVRMAADDAKMGFVFARRGIVPEACSSWFLPRLVGMQQAKRLALLADMIEADEAHRLGLVTWVVAPEELDGFVADVAARLAATAPVAVAQSKALLHENADRPLREALASEARAQAVNFATADAPEAFAAFTEKRDATFTGAWAVPVSRS